MVQYPKEKSMKYKLVSLTLIFFNFFVHQSIISQELTAIEIIQKADAKVRGETNQSVMEMEIIRPTWKRNISLKGWSNGLDYSMTYITSSCQG